MILWLVKVVKSIPVLEQFTKVKWKYTFIIIRGCTENINFSIICQIPLAYKLQTMAPIVYMVLPQTFIVFVSWCWQLAPIDLLCVGLLIILQVLWSSDGWDGVSVDTRTHATEGLRCSGASHRALAWSQGQIWVLGNAEDRTQALPRCRRCSMLASHTSHINQAPLFPVCVCSKRPDAGEPGWAAWGKETQEQG